MKAITEFPSFTLTKALQTKVALLAEGKTADEVTASFGETYKYEGDKLKHFMNAVDVATENKENLKRVLVLSLGENETAPAKAVKIEETYYVPEFVALVRPTPMPAGKGGPQKGGRKGGQDSKKSSPWGLSPEEKAAKNKKAT
jgi:hypothetical protein